MSSNRDAGLFPLRMLRNVRRHLRWALSWDLRSIPITDGEREKLMAAGVGQEPLHRYAIWRRSTLVVVLGPTLLAAILATRDTIGDGREGLSRTGTTLVLLSTLVTWSLPLAAFLASWSWASLRRSHRALIAGWIAAFIPPFIIALVPLGWWFEVKGSPEEQAAMQRQIAVLNVLNGLYVTFTLLPTALAVLPGLVRACLRVKSLLPAAILPGWFLVVAPPFYLLLAVVALIALNHLAGSPLLIVGVLLSIGAPMIYVWRADLFVRPLVEGECAAIGRVQGAATVSAVAGGLLLLAYLFTKQVFGLHLVGLDAEKSLVWLWENRDQVPLKPGEALAHAKSLYWLGDISLFQLIVQYAGRSLFMTTVFADLLVRMSLSLWGQEKQFAGSAAEKSYDETMADLKRALVAK